MVANISSVVRGFKFNENDIHLIVLPLGHTASINYSFLPATLCGATIVLSESFWKIRAQFWSLIQKYKVTYVEVVPSILLALLNTPYSKNDYTNIDSLQFIGCGSSMLPLERQIRFVEQYGIKVANLYGLSETGPTHIDYPIKEGWKPGSIGVPLDVNEVKIVNEDNQVLMKDEIGEIIVKGENVFIGYYGNHELYDQVVKEGYFYTGDLGYIDKDGKHHFVGRKKELIIKGGINILPDEIDEIIYKIDEVAETLTLGMRDEYLGEKIISYIVLKKEYKVTADEILSHCRDFLSRDKIPDKIEFVENIPKGHSGKFLRKELGSK
jgi:long-chain acyl-CoA synthetase